MKAKLFILTFFIIPVFLSAQIKLRSDNFFQIGYSTYTPLTIGGYTAYGVNNGAWAIEYYNGGLNFWKPWPTVNSGDYKLFIRDDNGFVGIGRNPSYKLDVAGDIRANVAVIVSDARLKTNINPLADCKNKINLLNGKSYNKISLPKRKIDLTGVTDSIKLKTLQAESAREDKENTSELGLLAQEVKTVYPELVSEDADGYMAVNYIGLIPVIIEALKEQNKTIDAQNLKLKELEGKLASTDQKGKSNVKYNLLNGTLKDSSAGSTADTYLFQNMPNPFDQSTEIRYFIPEEVKSAALYIFDLQGLMKKTIPIAKTGQGSIIVHKSELKPGMYVYSIFFDGKEMDTKRMILTE